MACGSKISGFRDYTFVNLEMGGIVSPLLRGSCGPWSLNVTDRKSQGRFAPGAAVKKPFRVETFLTVARLPNISSFDKWVTPSGAQNQRNRPSAYPEARFASVRAVIVRTFGPSGLGFDFEMSTGLEALQAASEVRDLGFQRMRRASMFAYHAEPRSRPHNQGVKSVVLLSGGLDSATCLAIAKSDLTEPYALTVIYGQRHRVEIESAKRVAAAQGAIEHRFVSVDLHAIGGSALTDDIEVPKDRGEAEMKDIPVTYVPARNTVMLALALGYAEVVGGEAIYAGVNAVDYSGYPDCRPEYIEAFQDLARLATKAGVEGRPIEIRTPLIALTKPQIIRKGLELGVDYSLTHSCYDPVDGIACGRCDSCVIREKGFSSLGMADPAIRR